MFDKNIGDTLFEVKRIEIAMGDKLEEHTELIIELDSLTMNIERKDREIARMKQELEIIQEEEEKER